MARLHRGGRTRAWIGRLLGGDETLGDRIYRRALHVAGAAVLLVYVLPANTFGPIPIRYVLVAALAGVLFLEVLRHQSGWELPTIRPHEQQRIASFALYAIALVVAVLVFPEAVAVAVVLGAALVDPLLGELRLWNRPRWAVALPGALTYFVIAVAALSLVGHYGPAEAGSLAAVAAIAGVAVEGPDSPIPADDDLTMTLVPGVVLLLLLSIAHFTGSSLL